MPKAWKATADFLARIAAVPRNVRTAARIRRAQVSLAKWHASREGSIESAISELESALAVLHRDRSSALWILSQRLLGEAYLEREAGDPGEYRERGIAVLETVQACGIAAVGVEAWSVTQENLGQAYLRRPNGDHAQNRARAVAAFQAVMSLPVGDGGLPAGWGSALAWLTMVSMVDADHRYAPRPAQQTHDEELLPDPHWHVPWYFDDAAHDLQLGLNNFLRSRDVPVRDVPERVEIEVYRLTRLDEMVRQLEERRIARQRTESLFREIGTHGRPFVLFLRDFNNRVLTRSTGGILLRGTGNLESFSLTHVVASAAPMPVVWVVNPVESPAIDQMVARVEADAMGFRVEAGEDWEQVVRALASSASFIVMHNKAMTPGIVAELELLRHTGRLGETFFEDAVAANQACNRTDCSQLDERAFATISGHTTARPSVGTLPPAMCRWVGGSRRTEMQREAQAVSQLMRRLDEEQHSVFTDLKLDAGAFALSYCVLLERPEELAGLAARQAALFERLGRECAELAEACSRLATAMGASAEPFATSNADGSDG